jgi:hypothetical protein
LPSVTTSGASRGYRQRTGLGQLQLPAEDRGVHDVVVPLDEAAQQVHVAGGVEGVRRSLAVGAAESAQLGVGQVEAVHRHQHGALAERLHERLGKGRLARAGSAGDPEQRPS